ncbi:ankyrin repeat domain-containing protein [Wolbachia endosymbiont (group B) of Germaria angustata]|uniref:ankyrin repeat domain-containing protein n=1 Tax=Wolbachia endosymbiont (group B) of Germaria angustata TaxID=3077916 RepID=UPI0031332410
MLQKQSSVGYLKSTKINSQAKDKSFQFKRRIRRQYNPDDINIAKLFLAIREHRTGNPQLDKTNAIKELLTQVDNINDTDYNDNGNTPLHVAVSKRHLDIVKLLLSTRDINPKAKNNRGQTPLDVINEDLNSKSKTSLDQDIIQELQGASSLKRENTGENKPEVGSPKKLRISSIKKEEPEGAKIEEGDPRTYPASGLKHTLHGNIYQLKLLMLFLKRGLEEGYSFRLATEWDNAEKFDDLVFIHDDQNRGKSYRFLQAKHKQNEDNKKIGIGDLLTEDKNGEFGLAKYFISYLKIKNNQDFADGVLKDFIICTNIGFDLDQDTAQNGVKKLKMQTKGKNKGKEILVKMIEDNDVFFKDGGKRYKLFDDKDNMALAVQQEFKVAVEETIPKLETEIKKLQDKSDQDSKNKLKQIQKWKKEFKQIANSGLEKNIKNFFGELVFAVNQPNEDKLATILQDKIGKEFEEKFNYAGNLSEDAYNKFQRVVQDWMKERQGRFLSYEEVKDFFNSFESRVSTVVEIKQKLEYLIEHTVKAQNNKQAQKDVWFDAENPSELFVGRTEELEELHRALHDQGRIGVISQVSRISGLGGIGKTELAKKYICEYAEKHYSNVIWINAENDKTIANSFYRLASDKLGITIKNTDGEEKHVKSIIEEVFESFSTEKSLFVFDNAEGLEHLKKILPLNISMPNVKIPYILITSRSKEWGKKIRAIDLDTLSLDDSIKFIKKGLEIEDKSQNDQIGNLVEELQHFPLAIQQAIAHIKETQESCNFEGYLEKYREKAKELINYKGLEWDNSYTKTTYTVWEVTLDRIIEDEECGQLALDILNTMAYFAPENIMREMFLSLAGGSQTKLESAINLLVNYSMVNGKQKQSLSIHRLVQKVTRLKLQEQQKEEEVLKKALELIKSSTIKEENISHVTSVLDYASRYNKLINNFDFTYKGRKYTPLNLLIEGNREEGVKNILDNLRRERYPSKLLKVVNTLDEYGYSPLRFAIENSNLQIVKYLIENGADLDIKYEKGFTPLHFAALFGNLELARYLVDEEHVSFNVLDKYGKSPLHFAFENGRIELVKYLVGEKKANINVLDNQHMAPLHFVAENGNLELAKYLIGNGADFYLRDKFGFTPLERAIDRGQDDIVKYLTEVKNRFGFTYLHKAAWDGNLDLFKLLIKLLINHNADLYRVDNDSSSPLHRAAENGKLEIVRYIIDKKLYNIDIVNNDKRTPLLLAAQNGHLEIVKFLVDKGADFYLRDKFGFTPLERAIDRGQDDIVKYLTEVKNRFGFTYLHKAAWDGNLDLFKLLIKLLINHNADLYRVDNDSSSPLHRAAENGKLEIVRYIIDKKLYNIDTVNNDKRTPLLLAAQNGHLEIVKFLVDKGADFYLRDKFGFTPLERAIDRGYEKVKEYLEEKGRFVADECLPSPSYRQKREAESNCLFTWEDVDEFNEEKDEKRDFSKIKIDSEKFVSYIKDLPEGKQSQLIQLASGVKVTGESQSLVNKLIGNQKIMNHLSKVGKISGMTMHGMMAKNILADFLNGNYQGVAINVGFIAGGQGFAKVAEAASLKGLKLSEEGKLLVSQFLKAASPFLARSTSAFIVYDLVNQIKAFKNGTEEALVGIVGDSIYLGVDAAEIGIEVAEAFEVLEGVSSVTRPIGTTIGAVVFVGTDIYIAVKRVDKIDQIIHLKEDERLIEGLRAFMGMQPEQYIEKFIEKKQVSNQLVNQGLEYLKRHSDIEGYVFPTGKLVVDSDQKVSHRLQMDLDNLALLGNKVDNVILHRAKPDNPNIGKLFCLPTGPIRSSIGGENAYLCHNAIGLSYLADRTGNSTLIALGKGKDQATGFRDSPNIFLVDDGDKEFTGGDKDDVFILVGNKTIGTLDGGNGNNTLNLAGFALDRDYIDVKFKLSSHYGSIFSPSDIVIKNIHKIYGRKGKQDIIDYGCDIRYVDGQGGKSNDSPDHIIIPYCNSVNRKQIIVRPSTTIDNSDESRHGIFDYIILPDEGKANINIEYDYAFTQQRKHNFLFNYTLFDLASVNIENVKDINYWYTGYGKMTHTIRNVTFSFLSPSLKGKSINEKFDIIISDIPANASYIVGNNAEIKIGNKGNLYMLENTNQPVDEVINSYLTMANRLKKISFFIQSRNETVVIGSGNHEVIYNNPLHRSNLVGNGGENVYVIDSESEGFEINKLPLPEVVVYDLNAESSVNTIDLRNLVQQARSKFSNKDSFELKVLKSESDLLLKATVIEAERTEDSSVSKIRKHEYFTVRLKDGVNWYNKTHVIVDNFPVKISLDNNEWSLRPQPLVFEKDKGVIIVTGRDVEENTELIIPRKGGNYTFVREHGTDLMITNVFDANITQEDFCTITLSGFYEELKMETLSIKFADKEIVLKDHREEISTARDMNIVKKEHSEQVYNDVFNHAKSESEVVLVDQVAHKHRYEQSRHRIRNRRSENIISSGARPPSWINDLFGWVKSSVGGLVSSVANKFAAKESEDYKLGDTGAYSSGLEKMYSATIPQSRKSLVVTKGNIPNRSWSSNREKVRSNVTVAPEISTAVVNSALILGDLAVRFMNGTRYEQPIYENLLSPREQSMRSIDEDMIIRAIQQGKEKFGVPGTNMDEVKIIGNKTEIGK